MNLIIHTSNPLDDEVHYLIKLGNSNVQILKNIKGIGIVKLNESDITRHDLVKDIINAYSKIKK